VPENVCPELLRQIWRNNVTCPLQTSPQPVENQVRTQLKEGIFMPRAKKHSAEEIIPKLRASELEIAKGRTAAEAAKKIGVTEQTYYRWRKEYGGLRTDQAKRLKELEKENARLKRLLADAELDKAILREAASGNF
jgi:transposase-like protein